MTRRIARLRPSARTRVAAAVLTLATTAGAAEAPAGEGTAADEAKELALLRSMARQTRSAVRTEDLVVDIGSRPEAFGAAIGARCAAGQDALP